MKWHLDTTVGIDISWWSHTQYSIHKNNYRSYFKTCLFWSSTSTKQYPAVVLFFLVWPAVYFKMQSKHLSHVNQKHKVLLGEKTNDTRMRINRFYRLIKYSSVFCTDNRQVQGVYNNNKRPNVKRDNPYRYESYRSAKSFSYCWIYILWDFVWPWYLT